MAYDSSRTLRKTFAFSKRMSTEIQVAVKKETSVIGLPLKRLEDPNFITGTGKYIDDIRLPNTLHASFARSLQAHAKIRSIDVSRAASHPSVRLVLTGKDMMNDVGKMQTVDNREEAKPTTRYALAVDEVNYAGEPIALIVAEDRYSAVDAAELVEVDFEPLPVVIDPEKALEKSSPKVHDYLHDNIGYHFKMESGNVEKVFEEADHVVKLELENQLVAPVPLEPRGILASYDFASEFLTLWLGTQTPYEAREELAKILRLSEANLRVIAPDVGGAFGSKISIYPEDIVVSLASIKLGKPIKWVETRMENLLATSHGRGQKQFIEAAVDSDGRIHGLKLKLVTDAGAYSIEGSVLLPEETIQMAPGAYDIAAFRGELFAVFTNKVPQDAYRGAGRPEAAYLIERTVNAIAASLRLDPVKVRLKNFIPRNKFPFKTAGDYVYDTGDYERNLLKALEFANYDALRADQRVARSEGRLVGIGMATYTEICGFGPNWAQTAAVTVTRTGQVIIHSGGSPHGQGHVTPFAQIVAEVLGVDVTSIAVHFGDTMSLPWGTITAGSRSAVVGGTAVLIAARRVKEKMSKIAAKKLGLKSDRMTFSNGKIYSQESTGKEIGFVELAKLAYRPKELPPGMEPTLFEYCAWAPPGNVFPFGTHIAVVEVDRQTGFVNILKYFAVDDVGRVLNPLIVEGQVQGGALQGIGQALLEKVIYDENGQLLTATLMDYLLPSSDSAPNIAWTRTETPSPLNPLGVKGVGEAGTIAATPAIVNAVEDALSPFDVRIREMPLSPEYVNSLLREAGRGLDNPSSVVAVH